MQHHHDRPRVLGVDDDPIQARVFGVFLNAAGIDFRNCADPDSFLDAVAEYDPDLVLMDVDLPGARGYDLVRRLREERPHDLIPVIFATSFTDDFTRRETGRAAADGYLVKPVPADVLVDTVTAQIARWKDLRGRIDHDGLTGLLTHAAFFRRVEDAVRQWTSGVLVAIDLDDFKAFNDSEGHVAGDDRLRGFAAILAAFWPDAAVGRVGGDEFAILAGAPLAEVDRRLDLLRLRSIPRFTAGVAALQPEMDARGWRDAADAALYANKRGGAPRLRIVS